MYHIRWAYSTSFFVSDIPVIGKVAMYGKTSTFKFPDNRVIGKVAGSALFFCV
jgi:hypothetical protein